MSDNLKYGSLYQHLVHNEKNVRHSAMRRLRAYITANESTLDFDEFRKIWQGLFYCFWMSDKEEIQQEFARNIACSIHIWPPHITILYFHSFFEVLGEKWNSIDRHRMNKYLSLVRKMLESAFIYLRVYDWDDDIVTAFCKIMSEIFRQTPNQFRGLCYHLIEIYIHSWAVSFTQDVYLNDINIDEILANSPYDDSMTLEDLYYHKYVYRKQQRHGKEAIERFHAKQAAKRENAAPLAYKYTRQGRKEAKLARGRPVDPKTGKLVHTSPIAFLLHKKEKKVKTIDTPDIDDDIYQASIDNRYPVPDQQTIKILDVLFNCWKLASSDNSLYARLQEHSRDIWNKIITRFIINAEYDQKGDENPSDEIAVDALGETAAASLRAVSLYLREKAKSNDDVVIPNKHGKPIKKPNFSLYTLEQLPLTTRIRRVYNSMATELEHQIGKLLQLGIDFNEMEKGKQRALAEYENMNGEGEFSEEFLSMFNNGEGEMSPEDLQEYFQLLQQQQQEQQNGEGEMSSEELQEYLAAMNSQYEGDMDENGEGEMTEEELEQYLAAMNDQYEGDINEDDFDGEGEMTEEELEQYIAAMNDEYGEGEIDDEDEDDDNFLPGEDQHFDTEIDFGEGEMTEEQLEAYLQALGYEGENDDLFDANEDDEHFDMDEDYEVDNDDGDDDGIDLLKYGIDPKTLPRNKNGQPILSPSIMNYIQQRMQYESMKKEADAAQTPQSIANAKKNQLLQEQYLPKGKTSLPDKLNHWSTRYDVETSTDDDDYQPNMKKRKQPTTNSTTNNKNNGKNNTKTGSKMALDDNDDIKSTAKKQKFTKGATTTDKNRVNFELSKNKTQLIDPLPPKQQPQLVQLAPLKKQSKKK